MQAIHAPLSENEWEVLSSFLRIELGSTRQVFNWFISRWGSQARHRIDDWSCAEKSCFFYLEGTLSQKVLLVAHADTWWDTRYPDDPFTRVHDIRLDDGVVRSTDRAAGLGADDRAGCAMLSLLRGTGHSILVTEGEEHRKDYHIPLFPKDKDLYDEIHGKHQFMIQLDRKNGNDFKCYNIGSDSFKSFIHKQTGYEHINDGGSTDIVTLCNQSVRNRICGVNFSIGYHDEHHPRHNQPNRHESLILSEWKRTLETVTKLIKQANLPRFALD